MAVELIGLTFSEGISDDYNDVFSFILKLHINSLLIDLYRDYFCPEILKEREQQKFGRQQTPWTTQHIKKVLIGVPQSFYFDVSISLFCLPRLEINIIVRV